MTSDVPRDEDIVLSDAEIPASETTVIEEYKIEDRPAQQEDDSVSAKAKESGRLLKELVTSFAHKAKTTAAEKSAELKEKADADDSPEDAVYISKLGGLLDTLTENFDQTMDDIAKAPYSEQRGMYVGYKKVLVEELNVINARLALARRLAPVSRQDLGAEAT